MTAITVPNTSVDAHTIKEIYRDGAVYFYAGDTPFGVLSQGTFTSTSQDGMDLFQCYLDELPRVDKPRMTEAEFRDSVAESLSREGWSTLTEVYAGAGRIDIVAKRDGETMLVETKLSASSNNASHALGQLLFYSRAFPGASLMFASPEAPSQFVVESLASFGVACYGN